MSVCMGPARRYYPDGLIARVVSDLPDLAQAEAELAALQAKVKGRSRLSGLGTRAACLLVYGSAVHECRFLGVKGVSDARLRQIGVAKIVPQRRQA